MLDLKDREWGEFRIGDIFEIGTGSLIGEERLTKGKIPRISAKAVNNGIENFYSRLNEKSYREFNNFISISFLGDAFYHPYTASLDMKIHSLKLKEHELNKYIAAFIKIQIAYMKEKFSYGNQLSSSILPRQILLLPITNQDIPDWQFMEEYIREREQIFLQEYIEYAEKIVHECEIGEVIPLKEKEWSEFRIGDIFTEIQRGKRLKKSDHRIGQRPYVSSTAVNNGVDGFVSNKDGVRTFNNCLTVANSGSVGATFYHKYEFVASDHVTQLKNPNFTRYIYLFLAPIISRLSEKYSFNREINDDRVKREIILLPIDNNGNPDWNYMEQYAKSITRQKITEYLKYKGFEQK